MNFHGLMNKDDQITLSYRILMVEVVSRESKVPSVKFAATRSDSGTNFHNFRSQTITQQLWSVREARSFVQSNNVRVRGFVCLIFHLTEDTIG